MMSNNLLRKKPIGHIHQGSSLYRSLSAFDLTLMGIGAIIGAGVFVLTGIAAATKAGPAIVVSYMIAGFASLLAALAYAELAASIGGTGSAYSYAYAGFGEIIAWFIGWNLLLEYVMSVGTVAIGWAGYVNNLFQAIHINLPESLTTNPFEGGIINLLAVLVIVAITLLTCLGVKHSARFNAAIVFIKLITIGVFIAVASVNIDLDNWTPFSPFGWEGIMEGAALVFFAYIGFDALSTAVEEAIEPQKSIPIGIITSLIVCTLIYIIVSALLTGMVPYTTLNVESPVAEAMLRLGYHAIGGFIAAGAIAGLTTVMLVMFYGLTRICLAMTRDGLLPTRLSVINTQTHTPITIILITGLTTAFIAGIAPINRAAELVNIGTLAAFTFVCGGVMVLRYTHPDIPRPFRLPLNPGIPILGMMFCIYLMVNLPAVTWWRFIIWTIIGLIIYFVYGMRNSLLRDAA
ncbi:putative amino acid permease YhdG [Aquicella siphonis]|uniref:Putative amino acid permease YhdG n=1 Tax=Aquicella siphonis TaxID=254247 RepID=A0A5E4PK47_9COXI|nr:amino acid permease [Aquicella siphonis]VVC77304.1 putative amino acid permease YhdG [Aquicella siphonis]